MPNHRLAITTVAIVETRGWGNDLTGRGLPVLSYREAGHILRSMEVEEGVGTTFILHMPRLPGALCRCSICDFPGRLSSSSCWDRAPAQKASVRSETLHFAFPFTEMGRSHVAQGSFNSRPRLA